jgi:hypothetical protein
MLAAAGARAAGSAVSHGKPEKTWLGGLLFLVLNSLVQVMPTSHSHAFTIKQTKGQWPCRSWGTDGGHA